MLPALIDAVGWASSTFVVLSLLQRQMARLRVLSLLGSICGVAYSLAIAAWPAVGLHAALIAINIAHLGATKTRRKRGQAEDDSHDAYPHRTGRRPDQRPPQLG